MLAGLYADLTTALQPLEKNIAGNLKGLACPQLGAVNVGMYGVFPGYGRAKGV